ncbi:MAG: site-specific integrase [Patescibacteria group bacterium]
MPIPNEYILDYINSKERGVNTRRNYLIWLNKLSSLIEKEIDLFTEKDYEDIGNYLLKSNSLAYVSSLMWQLQNILAYLRNRDIVKIDLYKLNKFTNNYAPNITEQIISPEEYEKILDYIMDKEEVTDNSKRIKIRNELIIRILWDTGITVTEVINLRLKNIDFEKRYIIIGELNPRRLALSMKTIETAKSYKKLLGLENQNAPFIQNFVKKSFDKKFSARSIQRFLKDITQECKIESVVTPNSFRHTKAVMLLKKGSPPDQVMKILGVNDFESISKYIDIINGKNIEVKVLGQEYL